MQRAQRFRGEAGSLGRAGERETWGMVARVLITVKVSVLKFYHSN